MGQLDNYHTIKLKGGYTVKMKIPSGYICMREVTSWDPWRLVRDVNLLMMAKGKKPNSTVSPPPKCIYKQNYLPCYPPPGPPL